jgi:transaldolase
MGASFRSKKQVLALAGCDRLTISPSLLDELQNNKEDVVIRKLDPEGDKHHKLVGEKLDASEPSFRRILNEDRMATEKLAEGIQGFSKDLEKLESLVLSFLSLMKTS